MKAAVIILSDPRAGEEALGRLFNALAAVHDFKQQDVETGIYFQGAGTRWPGVLAMPSHPVHALYKAVEDRVVGVSCGCADVFGARAEAEQAGLALITDNRVPGTSGLPSIARIAAEGYTVFMF